LIAAGKITAENYITHRFGLMEIVRAFETVESRTAIKVVVNP